MRELSDGEWEELANKVAVHLAAGTKFYHAVDLALQESSIWVGYEQKGYVCSRLGKILGARKKARGRG